MDDLSHMFPALAVCPGCGEVVSLPADPPQASSPPTICAACGSEIADHRLASAPTPRLIDPFAAGRPDEEPLEQRRYSRGGLLRSLGGLLASRGLDAADAAANRAALARDEPERPPS
jgi:hypothetical protein